MKRKQKPWSPEARARHLEGVRRYQEYRREREFLDSFVDLAETLHVEIKDLCLWMLTLTKAPDFKEDFDRYVSIEPLEERLDKIRAAIKETIDKIKRGVIPDPMGREA
jgi:hypothetical protein